MRRASHIHQESVTQAQHPTSVDQEDERHNHVPYEIELNTLRQSFSRAPDPQDTQLPEFSLPPTDQGKSAWLVLASTFLIEALAWGVPFTFGIFQEYYSTLPEFADENSSIAIIGTVALGIMYLGSPVCLLGLRRWPQYRRRSSIVGLFLVAVAMVAASFATTVWQLILTQGVLCAVGASMMYYPVLLIIDEWFVRRKGLAFGIAWAGTGFSGLAFPFLISWLLQTYSFRTTLRVVAVIYIAIVAPALVFLKPRLPVSSASVGGLPSIRFALKEPFLSCGMGTVLESLGFFMPGLFLPTYARSLGYSSTIATMTVVLINSGAFIGSILIGFLVDRWHIANVIFLCTVGATLSVAFLWGLFKSAVVICIFAFLYGLSAGSFTSTWPGVVQETKRQNPQVETGLAYALLVASKGIGSVAAGPLSDALLKVAPLSNSFSWGYGSKYGFMIVFAAISNALGSLAFISRRFGWW